MKFSSRDCGGLTIELNATTVVLRCSGALWVETARLLAVADLHFEKGSFYAARGQMLPPYDTAETLDRLEAEVAHLAPDLLVLMGDSFHDAGGAGRLSDGEQARITALATGRRLIWLVGNHDAKGLEDLPGEVVETFEIETLTLRHDPRPGVQAGEVSGHLHPCAKVAGKGSIVRRRCFATDGERLVMPAFGAYAGGLNLRDAAFAGLFNGDPLAAVLGRNRLHAVGWKSLRAD